MLVSEPAGAGTLARLVLVKAAAVCFTTQEVLPRVRPGSCRSDTSTQGSKLLADACLQLHPACRKLRPHSCTKH